MSFPPPPDYCFELFLLLFVGVHLLLQNYNLNSWVSVCPMTLKNPHDAVAEKEHTHAVHRYCATGGV